MGIKHVGGLAVNQMWAVKPNVLIVSDCNKRFSCHAGVYFANLGAVVMIVDISIQDQWIVIKNLNEKGIKYASISREVTTMEEAQTVFYQYMDDCGKFALIVSITGEEYSVGGKLTELLEPDGGVLYYAMDYCQKGICKEY